MLGPSLRMKKNESTPSPPGDLQPSQGLILILSLLSLSEGNSLVDSLHDCLSFCLLMLLMFLYRRR